MIPSASNGVPTMAGLVCLLVDDETAIRTYLRAILERQDFSCLEAGTAPQAMRLIQKLEGRIDLIITDIRMPGDMNGIDLAYWVRRAYPKVAVVIISGYSDEDGVQQAVRDFEFIDKPFVPKAILAAVRNVRGKGFGSSGS